MGVVLKVMSFVSGVAGALALLVVASGLVGLLRGEFEGGAGMALLAFGFYGVMLSVVALVAGFVAYFVASGRRAALPLMGKVGLWTGGTAASVLALAMFLG